MAAFTHPPDEAWERIAQAYDLGPSGQRDVVPRGTVNSSFLWTLGDQQVFARIYEEQAEAGATREAALLSYLSKQGAKTPMPVARRDGSLVSLIAGKPLVLFPLVPGDMRCQKSVTEADGDALGQEIARLHLAAAGAPEFPSRFGFHELRGRLDYIARKAPIPLQRKGDQIRARLEILAARRRALPQGMVHGDLFRDNVLFEGSKLTSVLDFESAGMGSFVYDLAVAILAWTFGDDFDWSVARAICQAYERVRPLSSLERDATYDELRIACLRFAVTRITDVAMRGAEGKAFTRFLDRERALDKKGPAQVREALFGS
jgi:homoserine kinase type II